MSITSAPSFRPGRHLKSGFMARVIAVIVDRKNLRKCPLFAAAVAAVLPMPFGKVPHLYSNRFAERLPQRQRLANIIPVIRVTNAKINERYGPLLAPALPRLRRLPAPLPIPVRRSHFRSPEAARHGRVAGTPRPLRLLLEGASGGADRRAARPDIRSGLGRAFSAIPAYAGS